MTTEFTQDEIDEIIKVMAQKPPPKEETTKIPLKAPGSYGPVSKVSFSPLDGEKPRPLNEITEKEISEFENLSVKLEVLFGETKINLKELASLKEGSLLPLDNLCDDLVEIFANGTKIARGEVVVVDGQFGVKILTFTKN